MKVTVITATLNRGFEIERTIRSVLNQTYKDLEYWVIDGLSSDNTTKILEKYKNHLNFISEKDFGIYNAMNKGIKRASGDYLLFLNAGDYFISDNSLETLLYNSNSEDLIYGDILVLENKTEYLKTYPKTLSIDYFLFDTLPHPATLIKQTLLNRLGSFNEKNKIVSDWEFFIHAVCKLNCSYKYVNSGITAFPATGISSLPENVKLIVEEKERYLKKNYPEFLNDFREIHKQSIYKDRFQFSKLRAAKTLLKGTIFYKFFRKGIDNIQKYNGCIL